MGRPAPEFSGCRKKLYLYSEHSLRQYEGTNREYITFLLSKRANSIE